MTDTDARLRELALQLLGTGEIETPKYVALVREMAAMVPALLDRLAAAEKRADEAERSRNEWKKDFGRCAKMKDAAERDLARAREALREALHYITDVHNFHRHKLVEEIGKTVDAFFTTMKATSGPGKEVADKLRTALSGTADGKDGK